MNSCRATMLVKSLLKVVAGVGSRMLWGFALLSGVLGLALTQTTPPMVTPNATSHPPLSLTLMTTPSSLNGTTVLVMETNSSVTTSEMANETIATNHSSTSAPETTTITELLLTTSVTMATSPPVSTLKQQTTQQKTTQPKTTTEVPPKPSPTKPSGPIPKATTIGGDNVTPTGKNVPQGSSNNVTLYLLLPLVIVAGLAMLIMIVSYLKKRIRLDKLRHQLLPMYNFDAQEGEDWETELLTEPRANSQTPLNTTKPLATSTAVAEIPKLRFSPDTVDV